MKKLVPAITPLVDEYLGASAPDAAKYHRNGITFVSVTRAEGGGEK
jgi:hypothetical protein